MRQRLLIVWGVLLLPAVACDPAPPVPGATLVLPTPIETPLVVATEVDLVDITGPIKLNFWRQPFNDEAEFLQQRFIDSFTSAYPNITIEVKRFDYNKLYSNTLAAIQADSPPDLVAAYETQASEYYEAGALEPLDKYMNSSRYGLTQSEKGDYIRSFFEATKFSQYRGQHLTFPYAKSDLLLYTNMDLLRSLGLDRPASTWDEFLTHCRRAVAAGSLCWALQTDPSIFTGIMFSYGGNPVNQQGDRSQLDIPAARQTIDLYDRLVRERLGYRSLDGGNVEDFLTGRSLYHMASSSQLPRLTDGIVRSGRRVPGFASDRSWEVTLIPQATANGPNATVLFGANISVLKPRPAAKAVPANQQERQLAAWLFVKHLTSPDNTLRWGLDRSNGYFPVRSSVVQRPETLTELRQSPQFSKAFEIAKEAARPEPSALGWQEIRQIIADNLADLFVGRLTADQAHRRIAQGASKVLGQY